MCMQYIVLSRLPAPPASTCHGYTRALWVSLLRETEVSRNIIEDSLTKIRLNK